MESAVLLWHDLAVGEASMVRALRRATKMYDLTIIGAGTAGMTAAIYSARADLSTVVFVGEVFGGQIATTNDVENYPGFDDGITGPELTERMRKQALRFGAKFKMDTITGLDTNGPPFTLTGRSEEYQAHSVIVATGASPKLLGVPGELDLWGRGVSYCATCDGAFFRDEHIAVVGGGDSALQEALFLARFGSKVSIIHRRDQLRAGTYLTNRAIENAKIEFIWDTVVEEIKGDTSVESLRVKNVKTGDVSNLAVSSVFVYVGHEPNTDIFSGKLAMDDEGYLIADRRTHSNIDGIFVAGEAQDSYFRQAITTAGEGCMASMEAEKFVARLMFEESAEPVGAEAGSVT